MSDREHEPDLPTLLRGLLQVSMEPATLVSTDRAVEIAEDLEQWLYGFFIVQYGIKDLLARDMAHALVMEVMG